MTYLIVGLAVLIAYYALCAWLVYGRGPFRLAYNPYIAWFIRRLGMAAMTIGARGYVAHPSYLFGQVKLKAHEYVHYQQWFRSPFTFLPRYLFRLARYGYRNHPDEIDARKGK